jgi:DHA1 family multidrug resistance protein-like MFS transporter
MNAVVADFARGGSIASHFGVFGLAQAAGSVVGNLVGGLLYTIAGEASPVALVPWFVFFGWGILVAIAFWTRGPRPRQ